MCVAQEEIKQKAVALSLSRQQLAVDAEGGGTAETMSFASAAAASVHTVQSTDNKGKSFHAPFSNVYNR